MSMISTAFVITVHDEILAQTGVGRAGVHLDRLESVLGRIDQQMHYNCIDDAFEIAAWYGVAIAKGHAFVDANKRTGLSVMLAFLEVQGISIPANVGLDDLMVEIVENDEPHEMLARTIADCLYQLAQ
ncbi:MULTISPECIES: type II toxin-antitoxin system death-on-curing family toxin [unclassified Moraxella]|uniref:type II toxin-antitoxin system death-on-curing family toxin n=1 Tax=unclassified Moraxella TaxID=2685852 RepID=UPI00359E9242